MPTKRARTVLELEANTHDKTYDPAGVSISKPKNLPLRSEDPVWAIDKMGEHKRVNIHDHSEDSCLHFPVNGTDTVENSRVVLAALLQGMGICSVSRAPTQYARRRTKTAGTELEGRGRRKPGHPIIPFVAASLGPRREDRGLACCPTHPRTPGPNPFYAMTPHHHVRTIQKPLATRRNSHTPQRLVTATQNNGRKPGAETPDMQGRHIVLMIAPSVEC